MYAVLRHSLGHRTPPHRINFRAIISGLRSLGVQHILASAATGCLRQNWAPGTLALCTQYIDLSSRNLTLFESKVAHKPMNEVMPMLARQALIQALSDNGVSLQTEACYGQLNGPRYETAAEISMLDKLGVDVVGMTAATEFILAREAGIGYSCVAIVSNLAEGLSPTVLHHGEVEQESLKVAPVLLGALLNAGTVLSS